MSSSRLAASTPHGNGRWRSSILSTMEQSLHSHFMSTLGLCSSMFTTFFVLMSVFPYSGYMVLQLIPSTSKETAGVYAGFLSSSFMVGRGCSSYFWGQFADIYGRKVVLVIALVTCSIGSLLFGLSTSYAMAVTVRVLMGLGNGSFIAARTASSELAKGNKTLEAKGVGVLMSMVGYGMLIAPAVGGFLSEPLQQHPDNAWFQKYAGIFGRFPFLLPNLLASILAMLSLFIVLLCVEETLPQLQRRSWLLIGNDFVRWVRKWCCMNRKQRRENQSIFKPATSIYVDKNHDGKFNEEFENEFDLPGRSSFVDAEEGWDDEFEEEWEEAEEILDSLEFVVAASMVASREDRRSFVKALHHEPPAPVLENQASLTSTSLGGFFSNENTPLFSNRHKRDSTEDGKNDSAPVLQSLPVPKYRSTLKKSSTITDVSFQSKAGPTVREVMTKPRTRAFLISSWLYSFASVAQSEAFPLFAMAHPGQGLGLRESSIGMVGTISGLIYCIGQYFTFSMMMNRFGLVRSLRYGALFANLPIIVIPLSLYIRSGWTQIVLLSFLSGISMIFGSVYLGCNTIGANRSVDATSRATMNGLSSLGTSIGRGAGPIVAGFVVTGCMASGFFPPNYGGWVLYIILLAMGMLAYWSTLSISEMEDDD
ncbi:major facilitator superfamily transporter [Nitzschia inconspicua]|uniref:Major facilitator superfamily transporter n=1 Tax=Nitzschia inconspicua TaxID=303405 RepID=A0A9K3LUY7_9STRA|nr:major facilitator superfamily transporter [Nitzschia inconspicua]